VLGEYTDEWGCSFKNIQAGVIGEVKDALIKNWDTDVHKVHVPREWLTIQRDEINRQCASSDLFMQASACPRPFEQLQFLRGTVDLYMDLTDPPQSMLAFMSKMHEFYMELLLKWAKTDVDALKFMDDWGSQRILLINPAVWRHYFKPMYAEYAQIAHSYGKKLFMHSDGHILEIYPDLVEIGVDAVNSQIFCMGTSKLEPYAGKITFWGEIDRQNLLPSGTPADIDGAVRDVYKHLWRNGGCIAQCEFGAGAKPDNVMQVYASWDEISKQ
jgi:uroporphyrinogen-III decarboxylase